MSQTERAPARNWIQWLAAAAIFLALYGLATRMNRSPLLGEPAPELTLPVAAGGSGSGPEQVRLSELSGQVVVLDFWASWCSACKRTSPILNALHDEFSAEDVSFYAVNVEAMDRQGVQAAHVAFGTAFPTLHDRAGTVQRRYSIRTLPTVIVVGQDGMVRWASTGVPSKSRLRKAISEALN